jgi:hypothetical protein
MRRLLGTLGTSGAGSDGAGDGAHPLGGGRAAARNCGRCGGRASPRGGAYWVAYRTAAGRQHKVYLGKAEDLSLERLDEAAAALTGRVAGSAGLPLLATKLFVPRPRPDLVPRPRLLARLDAGLDAGRCSLLSAPAGAGKTSLLARLAGPARSPTSQSGTPGP